MPLLPRRALTLAQEFLTRGIQAIKADQWEGGWLELWTGPHGLVASVLAVAERGAGYGAAGGEAAA